MFRIWLKALSWSYGGVVFLRNLLYEKKIKQRTHYKNPKVISVGNLVLGGSGKTPLVIYLVALLAKHHSVGVLSRGYKRRSKGFQIVDEAVSALTVGDEPYLIYNKFANNPNIMVAVCEDRVAGIAKIIAHKPDIRLIILDDGFQHLSLVADLNILLTTFDEPFFKDHLLPLGRLREPRNSASRADIILVTKSPVKLNPSKMIAIQRRIKRYHKKNVSILFTHTIYHDPIAIGKAKSSRLPMELLLVTAIADPIPLRTHLEKKKAKVHHLSFRDHHWFSYKDILRIINTFNALGNPDKAIVTTEKDYVRLKENDWIDLLASLPIFYMPIEMAFSQKGKREFEKKVMKALLGNPLS